MKTPINEMNPNQLLNASKRFRKKLLRVTQWNKTERIWYNKYMCCMRRLYVPKGTMSLFEHVLNELDVPQLPRFVQPWNKKLILRQKERMTVKQKKDLSL